MSAGPGLTIDVDPNKRIVVIQARREFDITPITIPLPFHVWKETAAAVLQAEVQLERAALAARAKGPVLYAPSLLTKEG